MGEGPVGHGGGERRITLRDVARASGVSPTTVSFVLNSTPRQTIPDATRRRVREAAADLGYTPHRIARALREGTSRLVLLVTGPWQTGHTLESFIAGVDEELRRHGHTLLVHRGREGEASLDDVLDAVAPRAVIDLAGLDLDHDGSDWTDGLAPATTLQVRHLLDRGHERIAMALPSTREASALASIRLAQAQRVVADAGMPAVTPVELGATRESARGAIARLLAEHPGITAIAGFDDDTALLALAGLAEEGIPVPDRVAVIGFDAGRHGAIWSPSLTTVRIDAEAYGRLAARAMLGLEPEDFTGHRSAVIARESA